MGIAFATALSSWVNAFLLYIILRYRGDIVLDNKLKINFLKIIFSVSIMFIFTFLFRNTFILELMDEGLVIGVFFLILNILISIIIFVSMIFMLKIYSIDEIKLYLKK